MITGTLVYVLVVIGGDQGRDKYFTEKYWKTQAECETAMKAFMDSRPRFCGTLYLMPDGCLLDAIDIMLLRSFR